MNISFPEKILFIMNLLMMPQKKAAYFLTHENERKEIAHNAFEKIAASHTFHHRVQTMFDLL